MQLPWHHKAKPPKESAEVFLNLGISYLEVGQFQEALTALNQAISIKPNNPEVSFHLPSCNFRSTAASVAGLPCAWSCASPTETDEAGHL